MAHTHHDILGLFQKGFAGLCPSTGLWTIECKYQKGQVECPKGKKSGKQQTLPQLNYKKNRFSNYKLDSTTKKTSKNLMQQPKNPESATTTTQFFNNQMEGSTHCACGGRGLYASIFVSFWARICDVIFVQLGFLFFFQAPRVERLWALQKFHKILLASPRHDSWNFRPKTWRWNVDDAKSVKRNEYNNTVDLRSFGGVDAFFWCHHTMLQVATAFLLAVFQDSFGLPRSHHVTHGNRLSWISPDSNHWEKAWKIAVWQHGATLGYPTPINYPLERSSLSNTVETLSELNEIFPISLDQKTTFPSCFHQKTTVVNFSHVFGVTRKACFFFREEHKKFPHFTTSFEITGMFVPKLRPFRRFRCAVSNRVRFLSHTWQLPEVPLSNTLEDALIQQLVPRKAWMNERVFLWFG